MQVGGDEQVLVGVVARVGFGIFALFEAGSCCVNEANCWLVGQGQAPGLDAVGGLELAAVEVLVAKAHDGCVHTILHTE